MQKTQATVAVLWGGKARVQAPELNVLLGPVFEAVCRVGELHRQVSGMRGSIAVMTQRVSSHRGMHVPGSEGAAHGRAIVSFGSGLCVYVIFGVLDCSV